MTSHRVLTASGVLTIALCLLPTNSSAEELVALSEASRQCPEGRPLCVGVVLHIAVVDGKPVRDGTWLDTQLAEANRLFSPADIGFVVTATQPLPADVAEVETRRDRDRMGRGRHKKGKVHVFVVQKLANVDEPGVIRGVHWRLRSDRKRRWILLSRIAPKFVLAHELGHFFGLGHTADHQSIMNKSPDNETPANERKFVDADLKRIARSARLARKSGVIAAQSREK